MDYVQTFEKLKLKYDQILEFENDRDQFRSGKSQSDGRGVEERKRFKQSLADEASCNRFFLYDVPVTAAAGGLLWARSKMTVMAETEGQKWHALSG